MAVQVRPANFPLMLSQQLPPQQVRKISLEELATMPENNNNNSLHPGANESFSFILPPNEQTPGKTMRLASPVEEDEEDEEEEEEQQYRHYQKSGYNTPQQANHHDTDSLPTNHNEDVQEYSPIHYPHNNNTQHSNNSKSTESLLLKSNQLSGSVTPPPHQMLHPAESYSPSPLEHYPTTTRLPKVQNLKKSLLTNASGTNLNVYLRGSRRHSLTSTPITELLTSPKLKSQNGNGLLDTKHGSKLNNNNSNSNSNKNGHPSASPTPLSDKKKRLVNQFYNSNRITSPNSRVDLPNALKDHHQLSKTPSTQQILAPLSTPIAERRNFNWKEESVEPKEALDPYAFNDSSFLLTDDVVDHVLNNGGFGFNYDHNQIIQDDDLLNYLLNIDNIIDHRTDGSANPGKTFDQLDKIMANISDKTLSRSRTILLSNKRSAPDALKELERIQNYLEDLKTSTDELARTLSANQAGITLAYKKEIHENVTRLSQVSDELKVLESKSNMFKEKIKQQKSSSMGEMMENLDLLDEINKNLEKRSAVKKQRLIIQINVVCGILILLLSVYYGYKGK
ncbi:hypothetical protein Cantr_04906 [Candida viswanathii]|uniref:Uncharacterized protein n=1 Tax=Candida viswanathii TaxID=5486 RepID=A0A367XQF5_9ASCO|nr:hypothetical protein Cantr_04906 [Candida viswanathii]